MRIEEGSLFRANTVQSSGRGKRRIWQLKMEMNESQQGTKMEKRVIEMQRGRDRDIDLKSFLSVDRRRYRMKFYIEGL